MPLLLALMLGAVPGAAGQDAPLVAGVDLYLITLADIDSSSETFVADFYLTTSWPDSGAVGWRPRLEGVNVLRLEAAYADDVCERAGGAVSCWNRYTGTFKAPMDLRRFPFDAQVLPLVFESEVHRIDSLRLDYAGTATLPQGAPVMVSARVEDVLDPALLGEAGLPEWRLTGVRVVLDAHRYQGEEEGWPRIRFEVEAARRAGYYLWKVLLVLTLLVALAWLLLHVDPGAFEFRFGASLTLFLAAVAFAFVTAGVLPRIAYLTVLDYYTLGSYGVIFGVGIESFYVHRLMQRGEGGEQRAARVDRAARLLLPVAYGLLLAGVWLMA